MFKPLQFYFLLHLFFISALSYNIDTNFPIIYGDPFRNISKRSSYYGYSVILNSSWIQIGAPRANYPAGGVEEPGAAYHCKFGRPCVELSLGKSLAKNHFSISKRSWFGVSMDFEREGMGNIVVCGHRWMKSTKDIPGACYFFTPYQNLSDISNLLTPTAASERDKRYLLDESSKLTKKPAIAYKYALSQMGISVHFSQAEKVRNSLLLGAPGFLNWKGSAVKCENLTQCTKEPTIIDTYPIPEINQFDLFGYQVSSGCFFSPNELLFVAGAPRDPTMRGYVMIYQLQKRPEGSLKFQKIIQQFGETTGEYFGSSIAVADITNDGLDDLVVGAPFFTRNGDEGRVYVLEFHKNTKLKKMEYIEGKKEKGRFGTAVANIGDIDHDGFADIAVGAPYEGNGVVYIFYGRSSGLKGPNQRIPAEDIYKSLRGFGSSFSGRADMDKNNYHDIAIGSFLSGHAVILRSLPVVTLNAFIKPVTRQLSIQSSDSKAVVDVCVLYSGINVPVLNVTRRISADRSYGRAIPSFIQDTVLMSVDNSFCNHYNFTVKHNAAMQQSLEFLLSVHVTNNSNLSTKSKFLLVQEDGSIYGTDGFYRLDPKQRMSGGNSESQLQIPYSQACKSDICEPDLQLECFLLKDRNIFNLSKPFIIGSTANYQLRIDVTNSGEPSYTTYTEIKFSKGIRLATVAHMCSKIHDTVQCQLGIIKNNSKEETITLNLDTSFVEEMFDDQTLQIDVRVSTTANDKNIKNNFKKLILHLSLDVNAHLYGKSQKDSYPISKLENGSLASIVEVVQTYEVHKKGASPLKMLEMNLKIPVNITTKKEEVQFLSFYKPNGIIDSNYWYCSADFGCLDCQTFPREIEASESFISDDTGMKSELPALNLQYFPDDNLPKDQAPPFNRTLYINCSSANVKCAAIKCQTSELKAFGKVTLRMIVNVEKLGPLMGQKDIIYVTSKGEINILYPDISRLKNIQQPWPHIAEVSSHIIGKIPKKEVDIWIIVASVIGGILLAMFVTMGLAKAGFFQRQAKKDLKELKERARHSQMSPEPIDNMPTAYDTDI